MYQFWSTKRICTQHNDHTMQETVVKLSTAKQAKDTGSSPISGINTSKSRGAVFLFIHSTYR